MDYGTIARRLAAYRKSRGLRQAELAEALDMTQGQYSKVENGIIKLSYDNLCLLGQHGCDIDELITGRGRRELLPCLEGLKCERDVGRFTRMLRLCEWIWEEWEQDTGDVDRTGGRLLRLWISRDWQAEPQWLRLRKAFYDISQVNMADAIGVNIKKYRLLEREDVRPDAELMMIIYGLTGCTPGFFMDERGYYLSLVNDACRGDERRIRQLESVLNFADRLGE